MTHEEFYKLCDHARLGPPPVVEESLAKLEEGGADVAREGDAVIACFDGIEKQFHIHLVETARVVNAPETVDAPLLAAIEKQMRVKINLAPSGGWTMGVVKENRMKLSKLLLWIQELKASPTRTAYEQWASSAEAVIAHWEHELDVSAQANDVRLPEPRL